MLLASSTLHPTSCKEHQWMSESLCAFSPSPHFAFHLLVSLHTFHCTSFSSFYDSFCGWQICRYSSHSNMCFLQSHIWCIYWHICVTWNDRYNLVTDCWQLTIALLRTPSPTRKHNSWVLKQHKNIEHNICVFCSYIFCGSNQDSLFLSVVNQIVHVV